MTFPPSVGRYTMWNQRIARSRARRGTAGPGTVLLFATLLCVIATSSAAAQQAASVTLRGHPQRLRLYGPRSGDPVIVSSGNGGWIHLGPHVADVLAARGFFGLRRLSRGSRSTEEAASPLPPRTPLAVVPARSRAAWRVGPGLGAGCRGALRAAAGGPRAVHGRARRLPVGTVARVGQPRPWWPRCL